jgi:predicted SnoaL-like aldol condensation-catalyzing enzyme
MTTSAEQKNVQIVLDAFDALFNKRDYAAPERFWSPNYIQHSAHNAWSQLPPLRELARIFS